MLLLCFANKQMIAVESKHQLTRVTLDWINCLVGLKGPLHYHQGDIMADIAAEAAASGNYHAQMGGDPHAPPRGKIL